VLNTFYRYAIQLKDISASSSLDLIDMLLKYGENLLAVDYYFSFIAVAH
jgi:hypothetical protein